MLHQAHPPPLAKSTGVALQEGPACTWLHFLLNECRRLEYTLDINLWAACFALWLLTWLLLHVDMIVTSLHASGSHTLRLRTVRSRLH